MSNSFDNSHPFLRLSEADRAMLRRAYSQSPAVWRFVPGRGSAKHMRKWLGKQGPADWHDIALHFDVTGKDLSPLHFIASQPNADRASIMSMVLDLGLSELERESLRTSRGHIHKTRPEQAKLLDLISQGFADGFYQTGNFRMNQPQSVLTRMHVDQSTLGRPPIWPLPARAWTQVRSEPHWPDYVWDGLASCQRLPFEIWVQTRLRPN